MVEATASVATAAVETAIATATTADSVVSALRFFRSLCSFSGKANHGCGRRFTAPSQFKDTEPTGGEMHWQKGGQQTNKQQPTYSLINYALSIWAEEFGRKVLLSSLV